MNWLEITRRTTGGIILLLGLLSPLPALAQGSAPPIRSFAMPLDQPAVAVAMPAGGTLRVTGTVIYGVDGTVLDAATETQPGAPTREGGLINAAAGGIVIADRDPATHTYVYRATGTPGPACQAILLGNTCVVLRLPEFAAERVRDIGEVREELQGAINVEIYGPAAGAAVIPSPWNGNQTPVAYPMPEPPRPQTGAPLWVWAAGGASSAGLIVALIAIIVAARRRSGGGGTPLARAKASAARLQKRLSGDPVKARLLSVVDELAAEGDSLAAMQERLEKAVRDAKPDELERRRDQLRTQAQGLKAEAGQTELDGAAEILEKQIDRCRRWEMQRWRSGARLERIATRLEALEVELNDPTVGQDQGGDTLLDALQEELELARAGEQEAEQLLQGGDSSADEAKPPTSE